MPGKSLMYTLNKAGPRIDLCGSQCVGLRIPDISEPIRTYCWRPCMELLNHSSAEPETPNSTSLVSLTTLVFNFCC